jgi:hypothetical protein
VLWRVNYMKTIQHHHQDSLSKKILLIRKIVVLNELILSFYLNSIQFSSIHFSSINQVV